MSEWPKHGDIVEAGPGKCVAYLRLPDGREPARVYLESLPVRTRAKITSLFVRMASTGFISNTEHFRKLTDTDGVFEFKRDQTRVFGFFGPERLVLLADGETKKSAKPTRSILEQVDRWYRSYKDYFQGLRQRAMGSQR